MNNFVHKSAKQSIQIYTVQFQTNLTYTQPVMTMPELLSIKLHAKEGWIGEKIVDRQDRAHGEEEKKTTGRLRRIDSRQRAIMQTRQTYKDNIQREQAGQTYRKRVGRQQNETHPPMNTCMCPSPEKSINLSLTHTH